MDSGSIYTYKRWITLVQYLLFNIMIHMEKKNENIHFMIYSCIILQYRAMYIYEFSSIFKMFGPNKFFWIWTLFIIVLHMNLYICIFSATKTDFPFQWIGCWFEHLNIWTFDCYRYTYTWLKIIAAWSNMRYGLTMTTVLFPEYKLRYCKSSCKKKKIFIYIGTFQICISFY